MNLPIYFRCKRSGNLVSFINEGDIQGLRAHEGYEEVTKDGLPPKNGGQDKSTTQEGQVIRTPMALAPKRGRKPKQK